jgi:hypothetical protein
LTSRKIKAGKSKQYISIAISVSYALGAGRLMAGESAQDQSMRKG